jgi:hypothetical protein
MILALGDGTICAIGNPSKDIHKCTTLPKLESNFQMGLSCNTASSTATTTQTIDLKVIKNSTNNISPKFLWFAYPHDGGPLVVYYGECMEESCKMPEPVPPSVAACKAAIANSQTISPTGAKTVAPTPGMTTSNNKFFGYMSYLERANKRRTDLIGVNSKDPYGRAYTVTFSGLPECEGIKGLVVAKDTEFTAAEFDDADTLGVMCEADPRTPTFYHQSDELINLYNDFWLGYAVPDKCGTGNSPASTGSDGVDDTNDDGDSGSSTLGCSDDDDNCTYNFDGNDN